jgi:hypothetical protein
MCFEKDHPVRVDVQARRQSIMSSTVTTDAVSMSGNFAIIGIVLLLALLALKELATVAGSRFQRMARILTISTVPLLIAFVLIVLATALQVIR